MPRSQTLTLQNSVNRHLLYRTTLPGTANLLVRKKTPKRADRSAFRLPNFRCRATAELSIVCMPKLGCRSITAHESRRGRWHLATGIWHLCTKEQCCARGLRVTWTMLCHVCAKSIFTLWITISSMCHLVLEIYILVAARTHTVFCILLFRNYGSEQHQACRRCRHLCSCESCFTLHGLWKITSLTCLHFTPYRSAQSVRTLRAVGVVNSR